MAKEVTDYIGYSGGGLYWKRSNHHRCKVGEPIGSLTKSGYLEFSFDNKRYYVHRVVWFLNTGSQPEGEIDHIDGNRLNNSFENLRVTTRVQNSRNVKPHRDSKSKFKGIYFEKRLNLWRARCHTSGKSHCGGFHETEEEAAKAYDTLAIRLHGEHAKLNFPRRG